MKASYKYQAEDMDELAFEVGEIINVVEYDDPEEQVRNVFIAIVVVVAVADCEVSDQEVLLMLTSLNDF